MTSNISNYFDCAAATPISDTVLAAMQPYLQEKFYNPSAQYLGAQAVKRDIEQARADVARVLGAKPSEIIFTAGGTEANNLVINGMRKQFPGELILTTQIEHPSIDHPAKMGGHIIAPVRPDGRVDVDKLIGLIEDRVMLVSVTYANNEIGTVQPIAEIAKRLNMIRAERKARDVQLPLYFHVDACQAPNYLPLLVNTLGVDMMTLNGGKIHGPKQSGVLYIRGSVLEPTMQGGGQERGNRPGTENVAGIIGFATALKEASEMREPETKRMHELQNYAYEIIKKKLPNAYINGHLDYRLPNNIHLTIPGADNERLMMELDEQGIIVATGSACSASSELPSHVLKAIGLSDEDARASLRITMGRHTTKESLKTLFDTLAGLV